MVETYAVSIDELIEDALYNQLLSYVTDEKRNRTKRFHSIEGRIHRQALFHLDVKVHIIIILLKICNLKLWQTKHFLFFYMSSLPMIMRPSRSWVYFFVPFLPVCVPF